LTNALSITQFDYLDLKLGWSRLRIPTISWKAEKNQKNCYLQLGEMIINEYNIFPDKSRMIKHLLNVFLPPGEEQE